MSSVSSLIGGNINSKPWASLFVNSVTAGKVYTNIPVIPANFSGGDITLTTDISNSIINCYGTTAPRNLILPTAANLLVYNPNMVAGQGFSFEVLNSSVGFNVTIQGNTGVTQVTNLQPTILLPGVEKTIYIIYLGGSNFNYWG